MTLKELLARFDLPQNEIVFLMVGAKSVLNSLGSTQTYEKFAHNVIDILSELYNPESIIIPSFTYSFCESGVYSNEHSKSETGRFSEELRRGNKYYRTDDPIFSVIDTNSCLRDFTEQLDYSKAFGSGTWREHLIKQNEVVVNLGLQQFYPGKYHFYEHKYRVPYRYNKEFQGHIFTSGNEWIPVNYIYYVRSSGAVIDRSKIHHDMLNSGSLNEFYYGNCRYSWHYITDFENIIEKKLSQNQEYLLNSR
jgi:aminoglycoside N3'-acetyltransferase